jgi:hypothetical protein
VRNILIIKLSLLFIANIALARDVDYQGAGEIVINVQPGEPTQMQFPGKVSGGFRKRQSSLFITPKDNDLIVFANETLAEEGEALIVRLDDGRSYPVRVQRSSEHFPRDPQVSVRDRRDNAALLGDDDAPAAYEQREFDRHNPNTIAGFMRELVLASEYDKKRIPGYRVNTEHKGETVLADGTLRATIDRIFIGPNMWGYVIDASNEMDISQQINPVLFRLHGTRAVSLSNWELAPKPLNIEQQISGKHKTKVYVITTPRRN